ncbi:MAG: cobalamin biosynthesis protein CobD [Pseudomonadota bacterium]|jgi:adenosylcobinamide-phosphate synthase
MIWSAADLVVTALAAVLALAVDRWLGEPPLRWHPVVWIGNYLGWAGKRVAPLAGSSVPDRDLAAFARGAIAWCAGAIVVLLVALALQTGLQSLPGWVQLLALGLLLKPMLAWSMLKSEVIAVESALAESLSRGRERLSWLCSRDTSGLSESQVRETALESLAENLNDSVVAPLFWFALAGLPGAALYRYANTADAMWGYRGERGGRVWEWAGKWAAQVDDLLSWLPARLTALLLALAAGGLSPARLRREAMITPSPNGGWPMGALALALGVRLGKPGVYTLNAGAPAPLLADTARACALAGRALAIGFGLAVCLTLAFHGITAHG